jgi:hypothetical protein
VNSREVTILQIGGKVFQELNNHSLYFGRLAETVVQRDPVSSMSSSIFCPNSIEIE